MFGHNSLSGVSNGINNSVIISGGLGVDGGIPTGGPYRMEIGTPDDTTDVVRRVWGRTIFSDTPGSSANYDEVMDIRQSIAPTADGGGYAALNVIRDATVDGTHDFYAPALQVQDYSGSAQPSLQVFRDGVGIVLQTPNVLQPITGALSAVTDANAKSVLTSIINVLLAYHMGTNTTT